MDALMSEPEVKVLDRRRVEIAYPSGRVVRYFYNHTLSELQLELIREDNNDKTYAVQGVLQAV